ncbi:MAG TPA: hypothetical protein VMW54_09485, partial [Terriglobia bacterium]|nr:hypothetical protein [Terriglobia bacterium]
GQFTIHDNDNVNCLGDGDGFWFLHPSGPVFGAPDTSYQYRNRNAMYVAAQQKRQKDPCAPLANNLKGTPAAGVDTVFDAFSRVTHPLEMLELNGIMFVTGGVTVAAGGAAIAGGCLEPTPAEPLTCGAAILGGGPTIAGGGFLIKQGVSFFKNYTLPAIKDWGCHE